jgi:hypothetical protein
MIGMPRTAPGTANGVFAAGFVLGVVREVWVVPRFGPMVAELMEAPNMLAMTVLGARWTIPRLLASPVAWGARLGAGLVALGLLLLVELTFVLWVRGVSVAEHVAGRDPGSGTVYVVLLGVFAMMPLAFREVARPGSHRRQP